MKTLTILEYAQKIGVAPTTVYRRIEKGALQAITKDGVRKVVVPDELQNDVQEMQSSETAIQSEYVDELKRQIERLEAQNAELLNELQQSRERSDTIVLQLTQQNEQLTKQNQLLLEDSRPKKGFFKRLFVWNNA